MTQVSRKSSPGSDLLAVGLRVTAKNVPVAKRILPAQLRPDSRYSTKG